MALLLFFVVSSLFFGWECGILNIADVQIGIYGGNYGF